MRKKEVSPPTPTLLEYTDGQRQQERNDLIAAVTILSRRNRRHSPTDLHVRELLTFVDRKGDRVNGIEVGIDLSYDSIATLLLCEHRTARHVVDRAVMEFGLLIPGDTLRYNRQGPNNYRIDRDAVLRAVTVRRSLDLETQFDKGDTQCHPPDTGWHPPDTECHPTPYNNSLRVSLKEETTTTKPLELVRVERPRNSQTSASHGPEWKVVVVSLLENGVSQWERAIEGAKALGFTPQRCMELLDQFRELPEAKRLPGVLYRWLTMARSAPTKSPVATNAKPKPFDFERSKQRHWFALRTERIRRGPLLDGEAESIEREAERRAAADQKTYEEKHVLASLAKK
jgi:hypothetical protein